MVDLSRPAYTAGTYAPWGRRALAAIIDSLIGVTVSLLPWFIDTDHGAVHVGYETLQRLFSIVVIISTIVLQGRTGASIGKFAVDIRVLDEDTGRPIGMVRTFIRNVMHLFDTISLGLGYLWPLWDRRNQTFADKIMGTVAIHHAVKPGPHRHPSHPPGQCPNLDRGRHRRQHPDKSPSRHTTVPAPETSHSTTPAFYHRPENCLSRPKMIGTESSASISKACSCR